MRRLRIYILNENGEPIPEPDTLKWATWFEKADLQIALDKIGEVEVSTVFLGLDHSFGRGAPLLFETMVFGGDHDGYRRRYATKEEALAGHKQTVEMVASPLN